MPEYNEEKSPSRSSEKRIEDLFNQIQKRKPELLKQLEKKWPYLAGASSVIVSLGFLIWYLEKKAQRTKKERLKEVIEEISKETLPEIDPVEANKRIGQSSVLLVAYEVAEDFKQLEEGEGKEEIKTWINRISRALKAPPPIEDLSENLVAAVVALANRVFEPEKKKEHNQK